MSFQGRKREGNLKLQEGCRQERRRTTSSFIPGSQFQSARGIIDCIHTLLEQLLNLIDSSTSTRSSQEINEINEDEEYEALKYKLGFVNEIPSTLYTNKQIIGGNGEPLQVAIFDETNCNPINVAPLSSSQVQFFILQGDFAADDHQISWTSTDFDQNILLPRDGKGPLLIGKDLKLCLNNGVAYLRSLVITDNSTWLKSRTFRLGAKVIDKNILAKFPRIGEALSQPFRVMDQRSKANKKHHPPRWEDEVWRLDGVGKTGRIINLLSSKGINTVGDFLTIHQIHGFSYLRELLSKVPDRIWNLMYCNALEYYTLPVPPSFDVHLLQNEAENLSGNLKVEGINDDDSDDLSNDTLGQSQFQAPLESFNLASHQKYFGENEIMGMNTNNVDDGHDHRNLFEIPNSPFFSPGFEKFLMDIEPMQEYDFLREHPLLSTHGEPSTSYNPHVHSTCFDLNSKEILMENRDMRGTTLEVNLEFGEKDHFEVGQESLYTSIFSKFISSSMEGYDLIQISLPTLHLDNLPSTSYCYNDEDLAPFDLSFEENFNENSNDGHGNLNTSNLVSTFFNYASPPLDDDSFMFPDFSFENHLYMQQSNDLPSISSHNHEYLASFPLSYEEFEWRNYLRTHQPVEFDNAQKMEHLEINEVIIKKNISKKLGDRN